MIRDVSFLTATSIKQTLEINAGDGWDSLQACLLADQAAKRISSLMGG